jgi:type II secretory pathway component PulK
MRTDRGYALVAALAAAAVFSYLTFQALAADEGVRATVAARSERAHLEAAAEAGVMIAVHGLGEAGFENRWRIDGTARHADFGDVELAIAVEDERAKAPLSGLNDNQARVLFEGAGASGDRLEALVAEFHDWRSAGAAPDTPRRQVDAAGELMTLKDMDLALYRRIAPSVTVYLQAGETFEPRYATPLALAVMQALGKGPGVALPAASPALALGTDDHLDGHTLSVHVLARDREGGEVRRTAVVEMTGDAAEPYWLRAQE